MMKFKARNGFIILKAVLANPPLPVVSEDGPPDVALNAPISVKWAWSDETVPV
jgi:hypothetical protein